MPWYRLLLFLHLASVIVGMGTAVFLHLQSIRRSLHWGDVKHIYFFGSLVIWSALAAASASGVALLLLHRGTLPDLFFLKLVLVGMLIVDGLVIDRKLRPALAQLRDDQTIRDLPPKELANLYQSGAVSFVGWWGALAISVLS